jgi:hypothetical protein
MESTTTTPSGALLARLPEKGALTSDTELTSHGRHPTNDIGRRADVIALTAYELFETETLAAGVARRRGPREHPLVIPGWERPSTARYPVECFAETLQNARTITRARSSSAKAAVSTTSGPRPPLTTVTRKAISP